MSSERALGSGSKYPPKVPGVLRLYGMRFCPYVKRTRLVLEHKNIPYETVNINLIDKPDWYLQKINCLGLVPSIETDDDVIFDSVIVNEYIDSVYPGEKLIPNDGRRAAKDKMLLEIWSKVVTQYYKLFYPSGETNEVVPNMLSALDRIENELARRDTKFFGGDKPMMIDFNMWPHMERIVHFDVLVPGFTLDASRFKRLTSWIDEMNRVPAVKKTKLNLDSFKMFMVTIKNGKMDCDAGLEE
ncbi:pyrimidodiazepine synthase-like isoform X1 [Ruditapes philippinarum]|uniref:pyrimidodiazepine synthase-like isoform X1 n=1 Tax=Ruditapes philippinarum TaxID=129788 RepID=UPI00295A7B16|nr:pyrimidodiazepine synthase-like isoform X1 [Ruditapes philippinarum]